MGYLIQDAVAPRTRNGDEGCEQRGRERHGDHGQNGPARPSEKLPPGHCNGITPAHRSALRALRHRWIRWCEVTVDECKVRICQRGNCRIVGHYEQRAATLMAKRREELGHGVCRLAIK